MSMRMTYFGSVECPHCHATFRRRADGADTNLQIHIKKKHCVSNDEKLMDVDEDDETGSLTNDEEKEIMGCEYNDDEHDIAGKC